MTSARHVSMPEEQRVTATSYNSSTVRTATATSRPEGQHAAPFVHPSSSSPVCGNTTFPLGLATAHPGC